MVFDASFLNYVGGSSGFKPEEPCGNCKSSLPRVFLVKSLKETKLRCQKVMWQRGNPSWAGPVERQCLLSCAGSSVIHGTLKPTCMPPQNRGAASADGACSRRRNQGCKGNSI